MAMSRKLYCTASVALLVGAFSSYDSQAAVDHSGVGISPQMPAKAASFVDPFLRQGQKYLLDSNEQPLMSQGKGAPQKNLPANISVLPPKGNWEIEKEYCALYVKEDIGIFNEILRQDGMNDVELEQVHRTLGTKIYIPALQSKDGWATSGFIPVANCRALVLQAQRALRDFIKMKTANSPVPESSSEETREGVLSSRGRPGNLSQQEFERLQKDKAILQQKIARYEQAVQAALIPTLGTLEENETETGDNQADLEKSSRITPPLSRNERTTSMIRTESSPSPLDQKKPPLLKRARTLFRRSSLDASVQKTNEDLSESVAASGSGNTMLRSRSFDREAFAEAKAKRKGSWAVHEGVDDTERGDV